MRSDNCDCFAFRWLVAAVLLAASPAIAPAQVRVNPTGVNVNMNGATTVFLTFGGLGNYRPVEATWCGELISAAPDVGLKCNPATIFGRLPIRFDQSRLSGIGGFTEIGRASWRERRDEPGGCGA